MSIIGTVGSGSAHLKLVVGLCYYLQLERGATSRLTTGGYVFFFLGFSLLSEGFGDGIWLSGNERCIRVCWRLSTLECSNLVSGVLLIQCLILVGRYLGMDMN